MPISYYLIPNPISKRKHAYTARISPKKVFSVEDIIQELAARGSTISETDARAVLLFFFEVVAEKSRKELSSICRLLTSALPFPANSTRPPTPSMRPDTAFAPASLPALRSLKPFAPLNSKRQPSPFLPRNCSTSLTSLPTPETPYSPPAESDKSQARNSSSNLKTPKKVFSLSIPTARNTAYKPSPFAPHAV